MIPDSAAAPRIWGNVVACLSLATLLAGCGTIYVNKADRNPTYHTETNFDSNRNTDDFEQFRQCKTRIHRVRRCTGAASPFGFQRRFLCLLFLVFQKRIHALLVDHKYLSKPSCKEQSVLDYLYKNYSTGMTMNNLHQKQQSYFQLSGIDN